MRVKKKEKGKCKKTIKFEKQTAQTRANKCGQKGKKTANKKK